MPNLFFILLIFPCYFFLNPLYFVYKRDLDFFYDQIKENHPGTYNEYDKAFIDDLNKFYLKAKEKLRKNITSRSYGKILMEFTRSFEDPHLTLQYYHIYQRANYRKMNSVEKLNTMTRDKTISLEFLKDAAVIKIETFALDDKLDDFKKVIEQMDKVRNCPLVIFDIRGNGGGNSAYVNIMLDYLFGAELFVEKHNQLYKDEIVMVRTSKDNVAYLEIALSNLRINHGYTQHIKNMKQAVEEKKLYIKIPREINCTVNKTFNGKVIAITDGANGSASLMFLDLLKVLDPNALFIGKETGCDTLYSNIRIIPLPSGLGEIRIPMHYLHGRIRLPKKTYRPDIKV